MKLSELLVAVDRRSGVAYDTAAATEVLNEALHAISAERDWPWLEVDWSFSTTAGRSSYSMPWPWRRIDTVAIAGGIVPLLPVGQIDDDAEAVGWSLRDTSLILSPSPAADSAVVVRGVRSEGSLVNNDDEPLMPEEWQQGCLVNYASAILLERVDELARADRCMARYSDAKRRMISQASRVKGPHRVRVRRGSML